MREYFTDLGLYGVTNTYGKSENQYCNIGMNLGDQSNDINLYSYLVIVFN